MTMVNGYDMTSCLVGDEGGRSGYLCYVRKVLWHDRYGILANDGNRRLLIHLFDVVGFSMTLYK